MSSCNSQHQRYGTSVNYLDDVLERQLLTIDPKKIVDFGAGGGKNGKIVRRVLGDSVHVAAVEGFQPTAKMLQASGIYTEVCYGLIQDWLKNSTEHYDLAIFGDVLEHLTVSEIHWVMRKCLKRFGCIIVIVPLCDIFQLESYGNKLEIHKSYITESFFNRYKPEEKHIKVGEHYTIMNVKIITNTKKQPFTLRRFGKKMIQPFIPILQPLGLALPLVRLLQLVGKMLRAK